ncbi:hypothetical protein TNIN_271681 [Trichonephila inaurata madagascariensis]|uniref:Uncharacterized protein n=1 Tax=Trichonephila inaurata madagascariensis TaxID=2747483 RepID=A0A8X6YZD0_9ARAC|nr:hypothetical protein TNIN_271681 [Trichonephila inaurata madagascariensis]
MAEPYKVSNDVNSRIPSSRACTNGRPEIFQGFIDLRSATEVRTGIVHQNCEVVTSARESLCGFYHNGYSSESTWIPSSIRMWSTESIWYMTSIRVSVEAS